MLDAYRDAYRHKGGLWDDMAAAKGYGGMLWLTHGSLCYDVPCAVRLDGTICYACLVSSVLYVHTLDHEPTIVRLVHASPKMRS